MTIRNRGKESDDDKLFGLKWLPVFKEAVDDLCFLLTRGYAENSALALIGNHYRLKKRQRDGFTKNTEGWGGCQFEGGHEGNGFVIL